MNFSKRQIIIFGGIAFLIIIVVLIFVFGQRPAPPPEVKLTIWGIEPKTNFDPLISAYKALRPNVKIEYQQLEENNYRQKVLDALASGSGPDIFMIQNKTLLKDIYKIYPALSTQFNLAQLRQFFPQVVEDDFVYNNNIYALPLYIDSLALFYNNDYFNKAGLVYPPATWDDFALYAQKLKVLNLNNEIVQAGAAMGSSEKNIFYATDILKLLLKQSGYFLFDVVKGVDFGSKSNGEKVLNFYSSFANPQTSNYTWPRNFEDSISAFSSSKVAMIFAYQKDISQILNKNPYLNFSIAPVPQIKDSNISYAYANYWALTVSAQSKNPTWAWDFIIYSATNNNSVSAYLTASGKPPALRSEISKYLSDPNLKTFASQALISRSWQEPDMDKIREIFNNVIDGVLNNKFSAFEGIKLAEEQAGQIMRNY
ncbi:MAG: extracellular solute-binding protein [Minisyncoccia bacterium]